MKRPASLFLLIGIAGLSALSAVRADDSRAVVAIVNGQPVFHSELFKSPRVKDDVDRALILQAYEKSEHVLPPELVGSALQNIVKESYGGDPNKLVAELQRHHATPEDYVRYVTEELVLAAMFDDHKEDPKGEWIADLRKQATIEKPKPGEKYPAAAATSTPAPAAPPAPTPPRRVADPRRKTDPTPTPAPR